MKEKIKDSLWGMAGIGFFILMIATFVLLIMGGAKLFEILNPVLEMIGGITWGIIFLLLILSIVPGFRNFTGNGVVLGTYLVGAIIWFSSFYITYSLWGFLGIFVGVIFLGLGIFFTAILALIFNGEFGAAIILTITLSILYFLRWLGLKILEKYRPKRTEVKIVG